MTEYQHIINPAYDGQYFLGSIQQQMGYSLYSDHYYDPNIRGQLHPHDVIQWSKVNLLPIGVAVFGDEKKFKLVMRKHDIFWTQTTTVSNCTDSKGNPLTTEVINFIEHDTQTELDAFLTYLMTEYIEHLDVKSHKTDTHKAWKAQFSEISHSHFTKDHVHAS